jgi:hypothetical protein
MVALPWFAWEMSLALWLIIKGFEPSSVVEANAKQVRADTALSAA